MPYLSPGAEATDAIFKMLAEQERTKQQRLLNQHTMLQDTLAQQREAREAQAEIENQRLRKMQIEDTLAEREATRKDKEDLAERTNLTATHQVGDIPTDSKTLDAAKRHPELFESVAGAAPGPVATGFPGPLAGVGAILPAQTGAIRFAGDAKAREAAAKKKQLDDYIARLPEDDPRRQAAEYERDTGKQPATGLIVPKTDKPLYYTNARGDQTVEAATGRVVTSVPANAEVIHHQFPPAAATGAGAASTLDDNDVDFLAKAYARGDSAALANLGWGAAFAPFKAKVIHRAAQFDTATGKFTGPGEAPPNSDLASAHAGFKADSASLGAIQKNFDAVSAFSNFAQKNTQLLHEALSEIPSGNTTWTSAGMRDAARIFGSTGMAKFNVARTSVANDYARIVSNPNLTGVFSDKAREAGNTLVDPNATVGQIVTAIQTLAREAENRRNGYQDQINEIKHRLGGGGEGGGATPPPTTSNKVDAAAILDSVLHPKKGGD